jgi:hypothetical protein
MYWGSWLRSSCSIWVQANSSREDGRPNAFVGAAGAAKPAASAVQHHMRSGTPSTHGHDDGSRIAGNNAGFAAPAAPTKAWAQSSLGRNKNGPAMGPFRIAICGR